MQLLCYRCDSDLWDMYSTECHRDNLFWVRRRALLPLETSFQLASSLIDELNDWKETMSSLSLQTSRIRISVPRALAPKAVCGKYQTTFSFAFWFFFWWLPLYISGSSMASPSMSSITFSTTWRFHSIGLICVVSSVVMKRNCSM